MKMYPSSTLNNGRRWFLALLFGIALFTTTLSISLHNTHQTDIATELPPAIADPEIGAGGDGEG